MNAVRNPEWQMGPTPKVYAAISKVMAADVRPGRRLEQHFSRTMSRSFQTRNFL